jgi:hypothetical protein
MRVFPAAVLVLLAFAAFFVTFLVAPLAVMTIFYVVYSLRSRAERKPAAAPAPTADEAQHRWGAEPDPGHESGEEVKPARRSRITVASLSEGGAPGADADAVDDGEPAAGSEPTATPAAP